MTEVLKVTITLFVILSVQVSSHAAEINVYDWPFGQKIFNAHLPSFEKAIDQDIRLHIINFPLGESTEEAFLYGEAIDLVGMLSSTVYRLAQAGWIEELSEHIEIAAAVDKMYEHVAQAVVYDGKIYGIGQVFTGAAVPLIDMDQYTALGYSRENLPKDWSSLSAQIVEIAERGNEGFYLPYWFNGGAGLPLGFTAEVLNRGGFVVDPDSTSISMLNFKGPAFDTLVDWRNIMQSGAVDSRVFDMTHPEFDKAFMQDNHIIAAHKTDALLMAKDKKANGHKITLLPSTRHSWGTVGAAHFGLSYREGDTEEIRKAKRQLLLLNTRGVGKLEFSVSREWLKKRGFFSVFKDYMESEDAQNILASKLYYPDDAATLTHLMENLPYPVGEWSVIWKHEFFDYMKTQLQEYLHNPTIPPATVINNLNRKILTLRSQYGY